MKTKAAVIRDNKEFSTLINAVISRIGVDSVNDVNRHGIDGGFSGFIYYADTHAFAMRHRKDIIKLLEYSADSLGEDIVSMVGNFGIFGRSNPMDADDKKDLYKYLGGGRPEQGTITNVLARFAAEEVCRMFEE